MKPFDLKAALAGQKVVTRDDIEVTQLVMFDAKEDRDVLYGVMESSVHSWSIDGKYLSDEDEYYKDLFMATNAKSIWVARVGDSLLFGTYPTKQECQRAHPHANGYHEITYEEQAEE